MESDFVKIENENFKDNHKETEYKTSHSTSVTESGEEGKLQDKATEL